jgi:hypothetical protein
MVDSIVKGEEEPALGASGNTFKFDFVGSIDLVTQ